MGDRKKLEEYFYLGIFIIAMFFAFVSIVQLYLSVNSLIGLWLSYKYQPLFLAIFSFVVLAICIYFIKERLISKEIK